VKRNKIWPGKGKKREMSREKRNQRIREKRASNR